MSSGVIKSSNGHSKINKFSMSWITMRFTLFASLNRIKTYNYYENGLLGSGANVHIGWWIGWAWIQTEMTSIHTNWSVVLTVEFEIVAEAAALNCRRKGSITVECSQVNNSQRPCNSASWLLEARNHAHLADHISVVGRLVMPFGAVEGRVLWQSNLGGLGPWWVG